MFKEKIRSFLIPFVTICAILGTSLAVIAYGRGYRLDVRQTSLRPTGIIAATSDPIGAQVFVNGTLKTATNNAINVDPSWYTVTIAKEGYIPWQKKIRVQGEVASRIDAFLFPTNPSLSPITTIGIEQPTLSPNGTKVAYTVPLSQERDDAFSPKKAGLWIYELSEGPLGRNRDPMELDQSTEAFDFSKATLLWSPDSRELMVAGPGAVRLYQTGKPETFTDITSSYPSILRDWSDDRQNKERQKLSAFSQSIIDMATSSAKIIAFAPDESKILYEATKSATLPQIIKPPLIGANPTEEQRTIVSGNLYVYDAKEDKNYFLLDKKELPTTQAPALGGKSKAPAAGPTGNWKLEFGNFSPPAGGLVWFPTSRHLILTQSNKIDIMEYDGTNRATVYSGLFMDSFVAPWPNGSRLVILTTLNPGAGALPNLYTVNLR